MYMNKVCTLQKWRLGLNSFINYYSNYRPAPVPLTLALYKCAGCGNRQTLVIYRFCCSKAYYSSKSTGVSLWSRNKGSLKWKSNSRIMEHPGWMAIDKYCVYPWTLSGIESCVLVKSGELSLAFDMGYALREAVKHDRVFITHGHHDHVSGIVAHASKRSLYRMTPATYYVPPHLVAPLTSIAQSFSQMHENEEVIANIKLKPISTGESVQLSGGITVKPFPTQHRVPSQGYIAYKQTRRLKADFLGRNGQEIRALIQGGVDVHDVVNTPEVAYTGDTMFDIFQSPHNPDLLKVKLLITESTYIDDEVDRQGQNGVQRARNRGHCHLQEFVDNRDLFQHVSNILFVHFSDKYSLKYIRKRFIEIVPEDLRSKLHLGLLMKEQTIVAGKTAAWY